MADQAVFGARAPQLMLRTSHSTIQFRDGEYRTSDPEQIALLLGVVADASRGDKGVWVIELPSPTETDAAGDELAPGRAPTRKIQRPRPVGQLDLGTLVLAQGRHETPEQGLGILEAAAAMAGERHTDHPDSVSPVVGAFVRAIDGWLRHDERQRFVPLVPRLVDSAGDLSEERQRAFALADFASRNVATRLLRAAGEAPRADALERQAAIVDTATAMVSASVLRAALAQAAGSQLAGAIEATLGVAEAVARLTDAHSRAAQARAHARWIAEHARAAEARLAAVRAEADHLDQEAVAAARDAELARARVAEATVMAETARAGLAGASAAAFGAAHAVLVQADDARADAEAQLVAAEELAAARAAEARSVHDQVLAAQEPAEVTVAARTAAARAARAAETAAERMPELVAISVAEVIAIAARFPMRGDVVDQVLALVERLALLSTSGRQVAA